MMRHQPSQDHISSLPEHIIGRILSMAAMKEAVRTSVLSKQWRHLWTHTTSLQLGSRLALTKADLSLCKFLHFRPFPSDPNRWAHVVHNILSTFSLLSSPVVTCILDWPLYFNCPDDIDRFLHILVRSGIQNLYLSSPSMDAEMHYTVPHCLFECRTLTMLTIYACVFPLAHLSTNNCWSRLKCLHLTRVSIPHHGDRLIAQLISSCNRLETLHFTSCKGVHHLRVYSPTLSFLHISSESPVVVCLENTPRLSVARIFLQGWKDHDFVQLMKQLVSLPLKTLGLFLGCNRTLENWPKVDVLTPVLSYFLNLKKLQFSIQLMHAPAVSFYVSMLRCCAYLEELQVVIHSSPEEATAKIDYWDRQTSFPCLTHHLVAVKIVNLDAGDEHAIGFVKYLLANTLLLKKMFIRLSFTSQLPATDMFSSMKKASRNAEITIDLNSWTTFGNMHNYSEI